MLLQLVSYYNNSLHIIILSLDIQRTGTRCVGAGWRSPRPRTRPASRPASACEPCHTRTSEAAASVTLFRISRLFTLYTLQIIYTLHAQEYLHLIDYLHFTHYRLSTLYTLQIIYTLHALEYLHFTHSRLSTLYTRQNIYSTLCTSKLTLATAPPPGTCHVED